MRRLILSCLVALLPGVAAADWSLLGDDSTLSFGSIKKGSVGETHEFTGLSGGVNASGRATVAIDLASVETWIDIRNERMAEFVFKDAPPAEVSAEIDLAALSALAPGEGRIEEIVAELRFAGVSIELDTPVYVARLSETRALVTSNGIIWVGTEELGIDAGIDTLRELAKLSSIERAVPVSFRFVFEESAGDAPPPAVTAEATAAAAVITDAAPTGDVAAGAKVFRKCKACHVAGEEKNKTGPHLVGIIGRKAASVEGFSYSKVFEELDVVWTVEELSAFLAKPRSYAKGTRMSFGGLKKEEDIENILAYLASLN